MLSPLWFHKVLCGIKCPLTSDELEIKKSPEAAWYWFSAWSQWTSGGLSLCSLCRCQRNTCLQAQWILESLSQSSHAVSCIVRGYVLDSTKSLQSRASFDFENFSSNHILSFTQFHTQPQSLNTFFFCVETDSVQIRYRRSTSMSWF